MWFQETVFYQIYPLGFCGTPFENDGMTQNRIAKVEEWIPHLKKAGIGAVLFNPVFESDTHGYNTRNFAKIDGRLGTNQEFAALCGKLHRQGIRVVLDGVFNHVGRGFWAFQDVLTHRENSPYKDWFQIDFNGNSNYNDGFWYEGWEGHFELVKLNLNNPAVVQHLLASVATWIQEFEIDGIRLDVAYCLNPAFMRQLRAFTNGLKPEFFLVGEMLHGDYKTIVQPDMLDSATNYECYKGLYSSLNAGNFFEIGYSLNRQFGPEDWTLYKGLPLLNFVDNHDVTRAASVLQKMEQLPLLYGMLFGMPGVPCLYYGSEWGAKGEKVNGDDQPLRACFDAPLENELFNLVCRLSQIRGNSKALCYGSYRQVYLTNGQFIFERKTEGERLLIALNSTTENHIAHFDAQSGMAQELLTNTKVDFGGGFTMPPCSVQVLLMEH